MINAVIFDIDGTLYSYSENDKIAMKNLCKFAAENFGIDEKKFFEVYCEARRIVKEERLTDGGARHSRALFIQTALEILGKNPFRFMLRMYDIYWNNFLSGMKLFDGAEEFIRKLKISGKRIALCTDMTAHIQYRKIDRLGLSDVIDCIVSSEETGLEKPAPMMFELSLKKLNALPSETAYFGDSLERDIEGAIQSGIKPFWYVGETNFDGNSAACTKFYSYRELINSKIFF